MPIYYKWNSLGFLQTPGILILLVIGIFSFRSAEEFSQSGSWVRHTHDVLSQSHQVLSLVETAESNVRGYVLIGDEDLRRNYEVAKEQLPIALEKLEQLVGDNPDQSELLKDISLTARERMMWLEKGLQMKIAAPPAVRDQMKKNSKGIALMADLKIQLERFRANESTLLMARNKNWQTAGQRTRYLVLFGSLLGVLFFLAASFFLKREFDARKKAVEEAERSRELALQALAVRSAFLANMSHEIRTPLHAIIGMADVLSGEDGLLEKENCVVIIRRAANLLMNLINDILDLSKIEAGKLEVEEVGFDLFDLVDHTIGMIAFRASQKGLELSSSFGEGVPVFVKGDPNRIRQILLNLIGNAIKFTPTGRVELSINVKNDYLVFAVKDTGIGISADKHRNVFEEFNQLDPSRSRSYGGTGLGLTISKQLVTLMRGTIWFESEVDRGSTFYFKVPLMEAEDSVEMQALAKVTYDSRPLRILVSDDIEDNRLLIQLYLKHLPYRLDFARNGEEVLEKANQHNFDLILMDMHMPKMDGYVATRKIREKEKSLNLPRIPIIALTAYALKEDSQKSLDAGCDRHLTKPITRDLLQRAIVQTVVHQYSDPPESRYYVYLKRDLAPLVPNFMENRINELWSFAEAIKQEDWQKMAHLAHTIKGVSGTFGFQKMAELGERMEESVRQKDLNKVHSLHLELSEFVEQVQIVYL